MHRLPPGFFLPVRVLSRHYPRVFLEKLQAAHRVAGQRHAFRCNSCRNMARPTARHLKRADQVRMKPSTSVSAQASVFSIGSPCMWRTVILVIVPWVKICAAILGGAGDPAIDGTAWLCGLG